MNYVDLSKAAVREQYASWRERLQKDRVSAPAVYVDDVLVSQSYIDRSGVVKAIEAARSNGRRNPDAGGR